ncbi:MAG: AI-2E family transporter [Pseudomonadota bacterium]
MIKYFRDWYERHFSDPQVITLTLFLIVGFAIVIFAGKILAPLLASIVIAYLLEGAVSYLERNKLPRIIALLLTFISFMALAVILLFVFIPVLSEQFTQFFKELPNMIGQGQKLLMQLPEKFPSLVNESQVEEITTYLRGELITFGQVLITKPLTSVVGLITILIYLILVPLLVFFLLKDKNIILKWLERYLPVQRDLTNEVWFEVNQKIASYVRGKFVEILIVLSVTFVTFKFLGLNYAMLLAVLVGVSVIIPYVGAAVVTIPVMFVAYAQWGISTDFAYVLLAYAIIQFLDGNILVPLLFSEVVNLHPVAIIAAVLFFGGLWGIWGVFFAIPLATLINAVINAWPRWEAAHKQT